jgi:hypothetical protein
MDQKTPDGDGEGIFLTDAEIQEFIEIYKQEFKEDLSPQAAREVAEGLLELYAILAERLPDEAHPHPEQQIPKEDRVQFPSPPLTKVIDIKRKKKPEK